VWSSTEQTKQTKRAPKTKNAFGRPILAASVKRRCSPNCGVSFVLRVSCHNSKKNVSVVSSENIKRLFGIRHQTSLQLRTLPTFWNGTLCFSDRKTLLIVVRCLSFSLSLSLSLSGSYLFHVCQISGHYFYLF